MHSYLDACIYEYEDKMANSEDCNYKKPSIMSIHCLLNPVSTLTVNVLHIYCRANPE